MKRCKEIDFLRGIAILLVVFFHLPPFQFIANVGWIGVDLFFVLSGYLVSGILFKEYLRDGTINVKRFLIRRGFKIYPLFYFFMAATFVLRLVFNEPFTIKETLGELLFIRNYTGGYWVHTWSLSVEEHFYFLVVFGILAMIKNQLIQRPGVVTMLFIGVMMLCLSMRIFNQIHEASAGTNVWFNVWARYVHTHMRIDSLLFGVLISYHYYLNVDKFNAFILKKRKWLLLVFVLGISPALLIDKSSSVISTIGSTLLYLGFGALLTFFITDTSMLQSLEKMLNRHVVQLISYIGVYSYSIYLWHLFVREYFIIRLIRGWHLNLTIEFVIYLVLSIGVGITLSNAVEQYFIRVRDKFFPVALT